MSRFDGLFDVAKQTNNSKPEKLDHETSKHLSIQAPKSKDPDYQRTTIYIPKELHRRFKSEAALQGKDMSDIVSKLLEDWLSSIDV